MDYRMTYIRKWVSNNTNNNSNSVVSGVNLAKLLGLQSAVCTTQYSHIGIMACIVYSLTSLSGSNREKWVITIVGGASKRAHLRYRATRGEQRCREKRRLRHRPNNKITYNIRLLFYKLDGCTLTNHYNIKILL